MISVAYNEHVCGIAGFTGENLSRIEKMTDALRPRGPDHLGTVVTHDASLGCARLAILDPRPEGNQPMWNDTQTVVITYNGEIFNYRDLAKEERFICQTGTDTEVILRLYERHGMKFLPRLRGMFAFGLYDTRIRTWHIARDANGILPLFLSTHNSNLLFASTMKAMLAGSQEKPSLNLTSLSHYLRLQYVPGPETLCEGIQSLPPGTVLTWQDGNIKRQKFAPICDHPSFRSKEEFRSQFPSIMNQAVKDHLISDKPVGIFLSGGMDSSILLHHMSHHSEKPIHTFTARFDATESEDAERFNTDAELARETAKFYGTNHHEILLTADICRDIYTATARALDQPNADASAMAQFALAREAKKDVDVVLLGSGGDELFGGYPRYRITRILHAIRHIPPSMRSFIGFMAGCPSDVLAMTPGPMLYERLLARPGEEIEEYVRGHWFDASATRNLFVDHFNALPEDNAIRSFMEFDRSLWLVDESLRLADGVTLTGNSVECRIPFLDPRVIAASHATPDHWHITAFDTKALLKATYKPILPHHIFSLRKACFFPPLAKWLRRECAPLVTETLEHPRIRDLFDTTVVQTLFEKHKRHERYALHTLSSLTQLRCWFEEVYD